MYFFTILNFCVVHVAPYLFISNTGALFAISLVWFIAQYHNYAVYLYTVTHSLHVINPLRVVQQCLGFLSTGNHNCFFEGGDIYNIRWVVIVFLVSKNIFLWHRGIIFFWIKFPVLVNPLCYRLLSKESRQHKYKWE